MEDRYIRSSDTGDGAASHQLRVKYFRKFYKRIPKLSNMRAYLLMDKIYEFEFDRWSEGKVSYNPFTKKNKPKHLRWLERQLNKPCHMKLQYPCSDCSHDILEQLPVPYSHFSECESCSHLQDTPTPEQVDQYVQSLDHAAGLYD